MGLGTLSRTVSLPRSWYLLLPVPGMVWREQSIPTARQSDRKGQGTPGHPAFSSACSTLCRQRGAGGHQGGNGNGCTREKPELRPRRNTAGAIQPRSGDAASGIRCRPSSLPELPQPQCCSSRGESRRRKSWLLSPSSPGLCLVQAAGLTGLRCKHPSLPARHCPDLPSPCAAAGPAAGGREQAVQLPARPFHHH